MAGALRHRGPDEFGVYIDRKAGLVHTRLSIVDLATGQQPLTDDTGSLVLVYNGELFNYLELRDELVARGHRFRTRSDTEVVLRAWQEWGEESLERFNGQWAFAIWDSPAERLILCRDRLGVRPLYYLEHEGRLYFASEVKALFGADESIDRKLDPRGLEQTFTFWSVVPPQTVFTTVRELEPGHVRIYERGSLRDHAYYVPSFPNVAQRSSQRGSSLRETAELVRSELEKATALRMLRADVPVASFLSGGLDSSLIAALGLRAKGSRFHTFSIRFEDDEYDETPHQRTMAERLGTEHHELMVTAGDIARAFPDVVLHAERPILRTAPAPLFLLSRLVQSSGIKVVLTGEGADEVFAGYDLFREGKIRRFWARHPASTLRPRLLARLYPYLERSPVRQRQLAEQFFGQDLDQAAQPGFAHLTRWRTTAALRRLLSPDVRGPVERNVVGELVESLPQEVQDWSSLAQDQYLEMRTLLAGYLLCSQGDRMLMAHSVEGRFPFLDVNVVALAASLPDSHKLHVLDEKHVLKLAAEDLVPDSIRKRPKQPYRAPDARAFTLADAPDWVDWLLNDEFVSSTGIFERQAVQRLWQKCKNLGSQSVFSNTDNMALVGVLSTHLLHEQLVSAPRTDFGTVSFKTIIEGPAA
jgi:asparagine synthase (glutamine-hydrolysing)